MNAKQWLGAVLVLAMGVRTAAADPIVLQWQTANLVENQFAQIWKPMVAAFEADNPNIRIEPILVARKDHWTRFVTAAQARRAPCVVEVDVAAAAYNGYLRPLDDVWAREPATFRDAWSEDALRSARWDGHLYAVPIWGGVYGEIYNRRMVVAAGLDPTRPPRTWDDYLVWMKQLTKPGQWGTALTAGSTDTTTRALLSWIYANGGEAFDPAMTEATFAKNPKSLTAVKFFIGLLAQGVAAPGAITTNYLEQSTLFAQEKIASMRTAYWAIAKVEGDNPALKGQMIVGPPPATIANPPVVFTQADAAISAACAYPAEAWKWIVFQAQPRWAALRATQADWLPLRGDMLADPAIRADPDMVAFLEMARASRAYPPPSPVWADIGTTDIVAAVQKAMLDPDHVESIFTALDATLTRKLKDL